MSVSECTLVHMHSMSGNGLLMNAVLMLPLILLQMSLQNLVCGVCAFPVLASDFRV